MSESGELECCHIDEMTKRSCPLAPVYEVWPRGRPEGFACWELIPDDPWKGYARYECAWHACAQHVEDMKCGCPEAVVVHLSRAESPLPDVRFIKALEN